MLQSFYNNLFSIEVTVFGIVTAAVFVFLQIIHGNFSYRQSIAFVKRPSLILYALTSVATIGLTGLGSLLLSLSTHNFFKAYDLHSQNFFDSGLTAASLLILFFLSIGLGFFVIIKSIKQLNPSELLSIHKGFLRNKNLKRLLYKKYGVPTPSPATFDRKVYEGIEIDDFIKMAVLTGKPISDKGLNASLPTKDQEEIKRREKVATEEFQKAQGRYEWLKNDSEKGKDALEGFQIILNKALSTADIATVKASCNILFDSVKDFVVKIDAEGWTPESHLPNYLARYIADFYRAQLEACARNNTPSLATHFVRLTLKFALKFLEERHLEAVTTILSSWKLTADEAIADNNRALFNEIIASYDEVAEVAFKLVSEKGEEKRLPLDETFRQLGWIAERLLTKKTVEEKPLMHDSDYYNEYDAIFNTLLKFSHKYSRELPNTYPLIYFDAIHVLFSRLLEVYVAGEQKNYNLKNNIFDCVYVYSSFALEAIKVENTEAVALAAVDLKTVYEEAVKMEAEGVARDTLGEIVRIAIVTASNADKMKKGSFLSKPIPEYLEGAILGSPYHDTIRKEVFENFIKVDEGNHKERVEYIKSLGVKMGTNFGFMFDETTGLDYPDDDPRRR